jgi:hypothetical protein
MADETPVTRRYLPLQVFDAVLIDDPAEQERLNRTMRRPKEDYKSRGIETDGTKHETKNVKRSNHRSKRKKKR